MAGADLSNGVAPREGGRDGTATGKGGLCICLVLFIKKKDPKTIWQNIYVTAGLTGVNVTI